MEERIELNSETLQENYSLVYQGFFSQNSLVVSAPRNFWWTGEYAELFGGLTITQKLPVRLYFGLQFPVFFPIFHQRRKISSCQI